MRVRVAARHSDLARLQAYRVGEAIKAVQPECEIEFAFRASLGDVNQADPLWKMPEKGVFTEDFLRDLKENTADIVVHSWKDLPTHPRPDTEIVATLPRADTRDLLLVRRDRIKSGAAFRVLTSSPRRSHNLRNFLMEHLPFAPTSIEFADVRGNIPTRVRKLFDLDCDALIVAKAALDRLLQAREPEFAPTQKILRDALSRVNFMVLPLTINPTAAAQGALAIEIASSRADLRALLAKINCGATFAAVTEERLCLAGYGGGCHQKIGITVLPRSYGSLRYLRGLTDQGEVLDRVELRSTASVSRATSVDEIFPKVGEEASFFERRAKPESAWSSAQQAKLLWVARETAWPEGFKAADDAIVWTAGLRTWRKLAKRGVWVSGSAESLGEQESANIDTLLGAPPSGWTKLTHSSSMSVSASKSAVHETVCATYDLVPSQNPPDLRGRTHFYWMSGTAFDRALELHPEVREAQHSCGPGLTLQRIRDVLGTVANVSVFLDVESWRKAVLS